MRTEVQAAVSRWDRRRRRNEPTFWQPLHGPPINPLRTLSSRTLRRRRRRVRPEPMVERKLMRVQGARLAVRSSARVARRGCAQRALPAALLLRAHPCLSSSRLEGKPGSNERPVRSQPFGLPAERGAAAPSDDHPARREAYSGQTGGLHAFSSGDTRPGVGRNLAESCFDANITAIAPSETGRVARRGKHLVMGCLLAAAIVAGVLLWPRVTDTMRHAKPVPAAKRPHVTAVAWSNKVFLTEYRLARWLNTRGASYRQWATKHPGAAAMLEARQGHR